MRVPLPVGQQILLDVLVPPVGACLWWLKARNWAMTVQSGKVSSTTIKRQKLEFWIVLFLGYLMTFGMTIYAWFIR